MPAEAARGFALDALDGRGLVIVTIPAARVHLSPSLFRHLETASRFEPPTFELTRCDLRRAPNEGLRRACVAPGDREDSRQLGEVRIAGCQPLELAGLASPQSDDACAVERPVEHEREIAKSR